MRYLPFLFLLIFLFPGVSFSALTPMVAIPAGPPAAGEPVLLKIYFHNEDIARQEVIIPQQLQLLVTGYQGETTLLSAFSSSGERSVSLAPGEFVVKYYNLSVPTELRGLIRFRIAGFSGPEQLLAISSPRTVPATPATDSTAEVGAGPTLKELESLYQAYAENFSAYEPTYFVIGTDPAKSKFQLSFKYRLFNPSGSLSRQYPWLTGFHMAYTQTSFWDLASASYPFQDTSYKPELFYMSSNFDLRPAWLDGFFIQTGIRHESNGRAGDLSRSTNYAYVKPVFTVYDKATRLGMMVSPRLLGYFNNEDDSNPDLADYRGYVDLEVRVGKANSLMLTTNTRFAEKGPSFQVDLTYPISRLLGNNLDIYLQLQYSNALAESLLHYRERTEALRLGIALVR